MLHIPKISVYNKNKYIKPTIVITYQLSLYTFILVHISPLSTPRDKKHNI